MIGYFAYAFDDQGRIRYMKLYPPDELSDIRVTTRYVYERARSVPIRAGVTSVPEGKVRQVP